MVFYIIYIIICALFLGGIVCLQFYLSKQTNRLLGFILPAIFFILSIVVLLSFTLFSIKIEEKVKNIVRDQNGKVISEVIVSSNDMEGSSRSTPVDFLAVLPLFFLCNIPTVVLILIYLMNRRLLKQREKNDSHIT